MWTPAARAELVRETLPYATCLRDAEWTVLALLLPRLPGPAARGDGRSASCSTAFSTSCAPAALGAICRSTSHPGETVYRWFLRWAEAGVFERLAHALTLADRERVGREAGPTGAILDAQAARSGGVGVEGVRGYDAAKRVVGRKRHALTDTDGRLLMAAVSPADLHDNHGGVALLRASRQFWPFLAHCFADRAYRGERVGTSTTITVEIVEPEDGQTGFTVQPRRWVIERTLGWISRCRRLARDHEATVSSALAFFVLAAAMVLVRRLARAL